MRSIHRLWLSLGMLAATIPPTRARAQVPAPEGTAGPMPAQVGGEASGLALALILTIGLIAIIALTVRIVDLRRRRLEAAVHVQARISDAFLTDPALVNLPVTATARAPLWSGSPVTVEVTGQVPTQALREAVLRVAEREASGIRPDVRIEDRVMVVPSTARAAA